jgi:hypothetical protein
MPPRRSGPIPDLAAPGERYQTADNCRDIFGFGTDMVRQWRVCIAIARSHEAPLNPPAEMLEPRIAAQYQSLQTQQLFFGQFDLPRFAKCLAPSLNAVLRRALAFNRVRCLAVLQQQERSGTRHQIRCGSSHYRSGFPRQIASEHRDQLWGPAD